jgi:hypothetical protein
MLLSPKTIRKIVKTRHKKKSLMGGQLKVVIPKVHGCQLDILYLPLNVGRPKQDNWP